MHPNNKTFSDLIDSQEKFWKDAYLRNIGKMFIICFRYTSDRQLSEDLAHDAFLKTIHKFSGFNGSGSFDAWLKKITLNHVLQFIRENKRNQSRENIFHLDTEDSITHDQVDYCQPPINKEKELLDMINALPTHHKEVFNLYVFENFSHKQIADKLGISPGTSKSHLARARKNLKQKIQKRYGQEGIWRKNSRITWFLIPLSGINTLYQKCKIYFKRIGFGKHTIGQGINPITKSTVGSIFFGSKIIKLMSLTLIPAMVIFWYKPANEKPDYNLIQAGPVLNLFPNNITFPIHPDFMNLAKVNRGILLPKGIKKNKGTSATISNDSILLNETIDKLSMKKLDTITAAVLLTSLISIDSLSQSTNTSVNVNETTTSKQMVVSGSRSNATIQTSNLLNVHADNQTKNGTFLADKIYWSEKNNEVYMEGRVNIDFVDNKFSGNGKFTFLGKVNALFLNGEKLTPGTRVKLSDSRYKITQKGNNGKAITQGAKAMGTNEMGMVVEIEEIK